MDDEDYLRDENIVKDTDENGFAIKLKDWQKPEDEENEEVFPQFMFEVDGDLWFHMHNKEGTGEFITVEREGSNSVNYLGFTGLINSVFSIVSIFKFLTDTSDISNFWWSWFSVVVVNGILWIPLTTIWPAANFGGVETVGILKTLASMTLAGPFLLYWVNIGALYYTIYHDPTASKSTFASTTDAAPWFYGYAGLSVFNSVVSALTVSQINLYYEELVADQALETDSSDIFSEKSGSDNGSASTQDAGGVVAFGDDDNVIIF